MSATIDKYIPLLDEVIGLHPIAIRHNATRCLGLTDDNRLSRQALLTAVVAWKRRTNATDDETREKLKNLLSVTKKEIGEI